MVSTVKVLFFARQNDEKSKKCHEHLKHLGFDVELILSKKRGQPLPDSVRGKTYDYILCYRSFFIIPGDLLASTKSFNINFHPGSPKYPGSGGVNLSLLNGDSEFGVTAHLMDEKVDAGNIIECRSFNIDKTDNLLSLLEKTHINLFNLFIEMTTRLKQDGDDFIRKKISANSSKWSAKKTSISEIDKLQVIDPDISECELVKRIRSLNHPNFPLEIRVHNHVFIYKEKL